MFWAARGHRPAVAGIVAVDSSLSATPVLYRNIMRRYAMYVEDKYIMYVVCSYRMLIDVARVLKGWE